MAMAKHKIAHWNNINYRTRVSFDAYVQCNRLSVFLLSLLLNHKPKNMKKKPARYANLKRKNKWNEREKKLHHFFYSCFDFVLMILSLIAMRTCSVFMVFLNVDRAQFALLEFLVCHVFLCTLVTVRLCASPDNNYNECFRVPVQNWSAVFFLGLLNVFAPFVSLCVIFFCNAVHSVQFNSAPNIFDSINVNLMTFSRNETHIGCLELELIMLNY